MVLGEVVRVPIPTKPHFKTIFSFWSSDKGASLRRGGDEEACPAFYLFFLLEGRGEAGSSTSGTSIAGRNTRSVQ